VLPQRDIKKKKKNQEDEIVAFVTKRLPGQKKV
jgi:hypothetical protein